MYLSKEKVSPLVTNLGQRGYTGKLGQLEQVFVTGPNMYLNPRVSRKIAISLKYYLAWVLPNQQQEKTNKHVQDVEQLFIRAMHVPGVHVLELHLCISACQRQIVCENTNVCCLHCPSRKHATSASFRFCAPIRSINSRARSTGTTSVPCFMGSDLNRPMAGEVNCV